MTGHEEGTQAFRPLCRQENGFGQIGTRTVGSFVCSKSIGGIHRLVSIRDLEKTSCLKMVEIDGHKFPSRPHTAFHHGEPAESYLLSHSVRRAAGQPKIGYPGSKGTRISLTIAVY